VARLDNAPGTAVQRVALLIATLGGVGHAPFAPGTVASAITALALGLLTPSRAVLIVLVLAVIVIGTWASHDAERSLGGKDPGAIVIDEVAGMALSVLVLPLTPAVLLTGFLLFRVFDIVKPYPANALQRLTGGVGVMPNFPECGIFETLIRIEIRNEQRVALQ